MLPRMISKRRWNIFTRAWIYRLNWDFLIISEDRQDYCHRGTVLEPPIGQTGAHRRACFLCILDIF